MTDYVIMPKQDYQGACDAIRAKTGKTDLIKSGDMAAEIEEIKTGGGGSTAEEKVNFYDYDGTLLHSYTVSEVQVMTELPELPTQPGLICQGWNWSLEDIKAENRAVDVGAIYATDDGKTRFYITVDEGRTEVVMYCYPWADSTIDWGDGTVEQRPFKSGVALKLTHAYATSGDYVITIDVEGAQRLVLGTAGGSGIGVFGNGSTPSAYRLLRKVELGKNVELEQATFKEHTALTTITIPNDTALYAPRSEFYNCKSLKCVVLPSSFTVIFAYMLSGCNNLSRIVLPNGVKKLDEYCFSGCKSLESITLPNSISNIANRVFSDCPSLRSVALPSGLTTFGSYVFNSCYALKSVTIPEGIKSIPSYSFAYCHSLESIAIPNDVKEIGNNSFQNCYALKDIAIPEGVTSIYNYAFDGCSALRKIVFPNSLTSISGYAFRKCSSLESITIPNNVYSIGDDCFEDCDCLADVVLPESVTSVNRYAFMNCDNLLRVVFPSNMKTVANNIFSGCTALTNVTIQLGATTIEQRAFTGCSSLTSLVVPSSVTSIGNYCCNNCSSLKFVDFTSHTSVPSLGGSSAFTGTAADCEIRVPAVLYDEWIAATNWSLFVDQIVAV